MYRYQINESPISDVDCTIRVPKDGNSVLHFKYIASPSSTSAKKSANYVGVHVRPGSAEKT